MTLNTLTYLNDSKFIRQKIPDLFEKWVKMLSSPNSLQIYSQQILNFDIDYKLVCLEVIKLHFTDENEGTSQISLREFSPQISELGGEREMTKTSGDSNDASFAI